MNLWRPIKADPHEWFSPEQIDESRRYNQPRQRVQIIGAAVDTLTVLAILRFRVIDHVAEAIGIENWVLGVVLALATVMVLLTIESIPAMLWNRRHERQWQLTDQATGDWAKEQVKGFLLSLVLFTAILVPVWALIRSTELWWLIGWLFFFAFSVTLAVLYPTVLLPIFNTLTPLEDLSITERIKRLNREAGLNVKDVYSMDASKQTKRDNAFFTGIGPTKRVVLYDNLLKQSPREIDVVIAHEMAHVRRNHMLWNIVLALLTTFILFAGLGVVSEWRPLLDFADVDDFGNPGAVPVFLLFFSIASSATRLLSAWVSRAFERQADLDSLDFTRDAKTFEETHVGMAIRNLGELAPSWWHRVKGSHPPAAERLAFGKWWHAQRVLAVLFTDIVGSSELIERIGDEQWFEVRRDHDEIVRARVKEHRGTEVDSAGDGFLLVFEDAGEALLCAIDIQRDITERTALSVRMGLHTGEVVRKEKSVMGRDVHVAARVSSIAEGGQILVSSAVHEALADVGRFTFGDGRDVELKGLSGTHRVFPAEVLTLR